MHHIAVLTDEKDRGRLFRGERSCYPAKPVVMNWNDMEEIL